MLTPNTNGSRLSGNSSINQPTHDDVPMSDAPEPESGILVGAVAMIRGAITYTTNMNGNLTTHVLSGGRDLSRCNESVSSRETSPASRREEIKATDKSVPVDHHAEIDQGAPLQRHEVIGLSSSSAQRPRFPPRAPTHRADGSHSGPTESTSGSEKPSVEASVELQEIEAQYMKRIYQLEEENKKLQEAEQNLSRKVGEKDRALEIARSKWKKTATELNKLRATSQAFYQVEDCYLTDMVTPLRYTIRDFTIQYFGHVNSKNDPELPKAYYFNHLEEATLEHGNYAYYLSTPELCSKLVQAFIWKVLVGEVFNHFRWLDNKRRAQGMRRIWLKLKPSYGEHATAPEKERKFRIWSADTVGLLLNAAEDDETSKSLEEFKSDAVKDICDIIYNFSGSDKKGFEAQLHEIVDCALALDREICRQVSGIEWVLDPKRLLGDRAYNSERMELDSGERPSERRKDVRMVVFPSMMKRGKSTGEDYQNETELAKMVVVCQ